MNSACASDCASVVRPWVANDTGGVPMSTKSQEEHGVLHSWENREYSVRWQDTSDGATPPADRRTGVVHPQAVEQAVEPNKAYAEPFGEPFTTSDEGNVAWPCKSAFSFGEAPGASTACDGPSPGEELAPSPTTWGVVAVRYRARGGLPATAGRRHDIAKIRHV